MSYRRVLSLTSFTLRKTRLPFCNLQIKHAHQTSIWRNTRMCRILRAAKIPEQTETPHIRSLIEERRNGPSGPVSCETMYENERRCFRLTVQICKKIIVHLNTQCDPEKARKFILLENASTSRLRYIGDIT